MSFGLVFKRLAEAEIAEAFAWYDQNEIVQGSAFLVELERVERFVRLNPLLYPKVDGDVRRANRGAVGPGQRSRGGAARLPAPRWHAARRSR